MSDSRSTSLGLVIEGGGVRGIYAAGVLDVLHDLMLPFTGVIGVSAGALHGCSFVSGQKGRSLRIYERFCRDPRFFSFRTWLRTGNIVDNDFCYHAIPSVYEPFDEAAFPASRMGFWTVSTNLVTGDPNTSACARAWTTSHRSSPRRPCPTSQSLFNTKESFCSTAAARTASP